MVLFLESMSYIVDEKLLLSSIFKVLKPGGVLYIKDVFLINTLREIDLQKYKKIKRAINKFYHALMNENNYEIHNLIKLLKSHGFIVDFFRKPLYINDNYKLESEFQTRTKCMLKGSFKEVFNVIEWYEVRAIKPFKY